MTDDLAAAITRLRIWADTNRNRASPMDRHTVAHAAELICDACERLAQEIARLHNELQRPRRSRLYRMRGGTEP